MAEECAFAAVALDKVHLCAGAGDCNDQAREAGTRAEICPDIPFSETHELKRIGKVSVPNLAQGARADEILHPLPSPQFTLIDVSLALVSRETPARTSAAVRAGSSVIPEGCGALALLGMGGEQRECGWRNALNSGGMTNGGRPDKIELRP
jgi:hypothetical protein